ncbi:hypothetical protein TWF718_002059 [Orbilia javanica]|uniref:Uncharacterized protein n=1 Tax=Orbilia javanica TaxID=47235 RepID=A0AAN8RT11_9PEZI
MYIKERGPRLTEIQSQSRWVLKKGYSGLIIPNYASYDVKTADLKVIVYHKWFELGDTSASPATSREVLGNGPLSVVLGPVTKPDLPKVTYLLHHEKFPIFIANADTIKTATIGGGTFQLENRTGEPIAAGRIKRFEIVPSSKGNLSPDIFDLVVQWAYTGDFDSTPYGPDKAVNIKSNRLDKKVAVASLLMGEEDLLALAIQKLRVRMDCTTNENSRVLNMGTSIGALLKGGVCGVTDDSDDEKLDMIFEGAIREAAENALDEVLEEQGCPILGQSGRAGSSDKWGKRAFYQGNRVGKKVGK